MDMTTQLPSCGPLEKVLNPSQLQFFGSEMGRCSHRAGCRTEENGTHEKLRHKLLRTGWTDGDPGNNCIRMVPSYTGAVSRRIEGLGFIHFGSLTLAQV